MCGTQSWGPSEATPSLLGEGSTEAGACRQCGLLGWGLGDTTRKEGRGVPRGMLSQGHQVDPGKDKGVPEGGSVCSGFTLSDIKRFYRSL